jgi:hypothetical protein
MYTPGPAITFSTSELGLAQKEQRSWIAVAAARLISPRPVDHARPPMHGSAAIGTLRRVMLWWAHGVSSGARVRFSSFRPVVPGFRYIRCSSMMTA